MATPTLHILPIHMDIPDFRREQAPDAADPRVNVPGREWKLQDCSFRMHLAPESPQRPMVHIDGGIECDDDGWHLVGYFGADRRQSFSVPLDPGAGEFAQMLASLLAPA